MTAPAIAPAPVAPVVAPVVQAPAPTTDPVVAAVEQLTPQTTVPVVAETDSREDRINRIGRKLSEHGKAFADQTTEPHPLDQATQETVPTTDPAISAAPVVEAEPAKMVPVIELDDPDGKMVLRARDPKTGQFAEMDQSKVFEMVLRDPETNEERIYQPNLAELMRGFKRGVRMQQSEPELKYYRENTPKWAEQYGEITSNATKQEERAQRFESLAIQLLTADEPEVVRLREQYASQFTPESENARLRAELDRLKNTSRPAPAPPPSHQGQHQAQTAAFANRTAPVVQEVERLVGREAAVGQMALFTLPLLVNGQIPPGRLAEVEAYIVGPYRQWAQSVATQRSNVSNLEQQKQKELDAARVVQQRAQQAANSIGSATRPLGGLPSNAPVALPPPKNREELIQRISRGPQRTNQMSG